MLKLSLLDFAVIVAYLGSLWGMGLYVAFRHRREDESFLLNRHFGWFNIGSSIFATNIGPSFLLGAVSAAYATGMVTASFEWLAWIFLFLLSIVFAPHYIRMRISTMPDFIRRRFGPRAAAFLSWYGLFTITVMWVGGDMFVGGRLLNQILGIPVWQCLVGLAIIFTTFTVAGGFAAVMVTDTVQATLMILSMLTLNAIAFYHVGSIDALLKGVPADYWSLIRPASDAHYPWPAIFLGYPILGFWFWCTDQTIVQRMLGARDLRQAQLGAVYTGFLKILPPFLFMMPGIFCLVLQPKLKSSDEAFLTMLTHYMPIGMLGLMISVLAAASVAGVAGGLNAFSTIFTMDIYQRKIRPDASPRHLKRVGQLVVVCVAVAALGAALFMQKSEKNIFDTLQSIIAYFAPPVATVFLLGIAWRRATGTAAVVTLYAGSAVSLTVGILDFLSIPHKGFWPHFMIMTVLLFLGCCGLMVVVSLLTRKADCEEDLAIARHDEPRQKTGGLVWILWLVLAVIMVGLYIFFNQLGNPSRVTVPPGTSAPSPQSGSLDYGMLFWHDGSFGKDAEGRRLLCLQTGRYGAEFDVEKAVLTRLGPIPDAPHYEAAVKSYNTIIDRVAASTSELSIETGGKIYRCVRGADPWILENHPQNYWVTKLEEGRKVADSLKTDNKKTNLRLREYGRYKQEFEIDRLRFEDAGGQPLKARVRLLVVSWPDVLKLSLEIVPEVMLEQASARIVVHAGGKDFQSAAMQPEAWPAGIRQKVSLVLPFTGGSGMESGGTQVEARDLLTGETLPVVYDPDVDVWKVQLNDHTYAPAVLNNLDRYSLRLVNPGEKEHTFRVMFANEMGYNERNLPPGKQGRQLCAGIMGAQMILRDDQGAPLGLPVQNAHNWPPLAETKKATPDLQPWLDLDPYDYNSWLRYSFVARVPARSEWTGRADVNHALWGGVPQASYYHLTLIGWGYYSFWDVAIQGCWGESICYSISGYADTDVADMRPLYVKSYDSHRQVPFEWTPNQGGANFLHYKSGGEKQYLDVRRYLPVPGPCLARTGFFGRTEDGKIDFEITAEHPRTDDLNRTYYRIRYQVLEDTTFDHLAFFQLGSTTYDFNNPKAIAWGGSEGLAQEIENPPLGSLEYFKRGLPFEGSAPWWISLHRSTKSEARGDQDHLGLASRGLIVRSWDAVLGGVRVEKPHVSFFGTYHRFPGILAEIGPPPSLTSLKKGDHVDMQIEVVLIPKIADSYLGTNEALRNSLQSTADTWQAVHRQARGNDLKLNVTEGRLQRHDPVEIAVGNTGAAEVEVTGGLAYVPFTFTGVASHNKPTLYELTGGVKKAVDQSDKGNDFWQTEYDPATGHYRITYNLNLDTPDDKPLTRRFRFESPAVEKGHPEL